MTDTTPLGELLKAVDVLTKEHVAIVEGRGDEFLGSREEQPLLVKLRAAVVSNMGGSGSGKPARERVPLNVGARDLYDRIAHDVHTLWVVAYPEAGRPSPERMLRQWYLVYANRFRAGEITDLDAWGQVRTLDRWVSNIRDLLDPPFRFELTSPCPVCGQEWAHAYSDDGTELERVRTLNAVERGRIEDSYVVCRNSECGRMWRGVMEARALRIAIDDAEALKEMA